MALQALINTLKHAACTVPMGSHHEGMHRHRGGPAQERQGLHDDGEPQCVHAGVPLREGARRRRKHRKDPVPPGLPPAFIEPPGLASYWYGFDRHASGEPVARSQRQDPWSASDRGRFREEYAKRYELRGLPCGSMHLLLKDFGSRRRGHAIPLRHDPPRTGRA